MTEPALSKATPPATGAATGADTGADTGAATGADTGAATGFRWRREDTVKTAGLMAVITALHVVAFGILFLLVVPAHYEVGTKAFGVGLGITAYTLGMRHAFDADHIAAIDNTTRKFMHEGQRPLSVGFFFSLGHSSVVFVLARVWRLRAGAIAVVVDNSRKTEAEEQVFDPEEQFRHQAADIQRLSQLGCEIVRVLAEQDAARAART